MASLDQPAAAAPNAQTEGSADAAKLQQCSSDNGIEMKISDRDVEVDPSVTQEAFMKAAQACQPTRVAGL